jgi:hypothetical protein
MDTLQSRTMTVSQKQLSPYLERLRALDFVQAVELSPDFKRDKHGVDGLLRIGTPKGTFNFYIELKNSYLDRAHVNALITQAKYYAEKDRRPLLLLARYVPAPSADKLIEAGVSFVDQAGNVHLMLGKSYGRTVVGKRERQRAKEARTITAAKGQLLFTFAAYEQASTWTVRQLAEASGVGKSNVATIRKQLVEEGILTRTFHLRDDKQLEGQLLSAYEQVLRPKLLINRFRAAESSAKQFLGRVRDAFAKASLKWSLTGGPAAFELQRFYKGSEIPIFIGSLADATLRELRVLPDRNGPLILLRAFGTVPFWKEIHRITIAHPWLIYCELMYSSDPRAHEAAEQLKAEFLRSDRAEQG